MFVNLCESAPELVCYDGETPPADQPKTFSQADLDKALDADKRAHQAQYQKLERQLQDTLQSAKLTADERSQLEGSLESVRQQLRTKEEQANAEKQRLKDEFTGKISAAEKRATTAEKRWQDSTIENALRDAAAAGDAFSADQVVTILRSTTKLVDDKPMVDFVAIDPETGEAKTVQVTPTEAIKAMKDDSRRFGNLFKSGVVGGIGGTGSAGSLPNGGKINIKTISMEQYAKLRKENPAALGLA